MADSLTPHRQQGQVLLIGLMLVALVTTIVGTGVLRSTTSTQSTKQREESNRASEIARGLLEQGTNDEEANVGVFTNVVPDATQLQTVTQSEGNTFVYDDIVAKDGQYTLYTADYDMATNTFGVDSMTGTLSIYYGSDDDDSRCSLLEIMEVSQAGNSYRVSNRYYTGSSGESECDGSSFGDEVPNELEPQPAGPISWGGGNISFANVVTIPLGSNVKTVIVRPFFFGTKLGFTANDTDGIKPQGRIISSSARTIEGAERTETVYQAFPQIPLSLFATIF